MDDIDISEGSPPLRLLVADSACDPEGPLMNELFESDDIEVVGRARKAIEALTLSEQLHPDAVLLDIEMPGETLQFVLELLKRRKPAPVVLVVIPYASSVLRDRVLDAGADHAFPRTAQPDRLLALLRKIAADRNAGQRVKPVQKNSSFCV